MKKILLILMLLSSFSFAGGSFIGSVWFSDETPPRCYSVGGVFRTVVDNRPNSDGDLSFP
jgi:hypothetical protein